MGMAHTPHESNAAAYAGPIQVRPVHDPGPDDIEAVGRLIDSTTAHDAHRPIGEHALIELKEGVRVFPHAAFMATQRDALAGYAHLSERETRSGWRLEAFVDPALRRRGVGHLLLKEVFDHVAGHGGGHIHAWAYRPGAAQARLADAFGMRATRRLLRMQRDLPAPSETMPAGYTVRSFRPDDAQEWLALHNVVFANHPDGGNWKPSDLDWQLREPWFDAGGFLLVEEEQWIAGYCWKKPDPTLGWVYFLGAHPRLRGTGVARALCVAGMQWCDRNAMRSIVLYVDEGNAPAVALYNRLGFKTDHVDVCYEIDIPASQTHMH
ncbi:MAG: mycothiol synthase [Actinomycetota bacterium]